MLWQQYIIPHLFEAGHKTLLVCVSEYDNGIVGTRLINSAFIFEMTLDPQTFIPGYTMLLYYLMFSLLTLSFTKKPILVRRMANVWIYNSVKLCHCCIPANREPSGLPSHSGHYVYTCDEEQYSNGLLHSQIVLADFLSQKVSRFIDFASNIFPFMDDLGQKINTFSLTRKHWLNHWHELTLELSVCATSFHKNCLNYYSHYLCSSGLEITRIVLFTKV